MMFRGMEWPEWVLALTILAAFGWVGYMAWLDWSHPCVRGHYEMRRHIVKQENKVPA